jgi:hypothetical protein
VRSGFGKWAVLCHAEPLIGDEGEIPPDRILLSHEYTEPDADHGAGPGDQGLGEVSLVGEGSFTGPEPVKVNTLRFRLLTTWGDKPGTYRGLIRFTYLINP